MHDGLTCFCVHRTLHLSIRRVTVQRRAVSSPRAAPAAASGAPLATAFGRRRASAGGASGCRWWRRHVAVVAVTRLSAGGQPVLVAELRSVAVVSRRPRPKRKSSGKVRIFAFLKVAASPSSANSMNVVEPTSAASRWVTRSPTADPSPVADRRLWVHRSRCSDVTANCGWKKVASG